MSVLLLGLFAKILPWALAAAGLIAAYFGVKAKGKSEAKAQIETESLKDNIQSTRDREVIDEKVSSVGADSPERQRLRDKWSS